MRSFWVLVDRLAPLVFLTAPCAPFLGLLLGALASRRGRRSGPAFAAGTGVGCLAAPVLLWVAMCTPPAGRGATAERRYRQAEPIVAALDAFRRARGAYPDSLADLTPAFLAPERLSESRTDADGPFRYARDTAGYTLRFEYEGPGMNRCEYRPSVARWSCGGYF